MANDWGGRILASRFCKLALAFISIGFLSQKSKADVILHAFNWSYEHIGERATEIADLGYRYVLVPTPAKSVGGLWWARYQPQDYRVIDHPLGNKSTFVTMIEKLEAEGVQVIADIVLNHMANEANTRQDLYYPGQSVLAEYAARSDYFEANRLFGDLSENFLSAYDFHASGCITNYRDPNNVQFGRICSTPKDAGLPDLRANNWVIDQQQKYIQSLKDLGVKGFRIDAAKHMPVSHINDVFTEELLEDSFVFGEVITYGGVDTWEYRAFLEPYLMGTNHLAYDFPLLTTIKYAFSPNGRLEDLAFARERGLALDTQRAITVATTHDIANSQFEYFLLTPEDELLASSYIIAMGQGMPLIYSETDDPGRARWKDFHKRDLIADMIEFHNKMDGEDTRYIYASKCLIAASRGSKGLLTLNKCNGAIAPSIEVKGIFEEGASFTSNDGRTITVENGVLNLEFKSRQIATWEKI